MAAAAAPAAVPPSRPAGRRRQAHACNLDCPLPAPHLAVSVTRRRARGARRQSASISTPPQGRTQSRAAGQPEAAPCGWGRVPQRQRRMRRSAWSAVCGKRKQVHSTEPAPAGGLRWPRHRVGKGQAPAGAGGARAPPGRGGSPLSAPGGWGPCSWIRTSHMTDQQHRQRQLNKNHHRRRRRCRSRKRRRGPPPPPPAQGSRRRRAAARAARAGSRGVRTRCARAAPCRCCRPCAAETLRSCTLVACDCIRFSCCASCAARHTGARAPSLGACLVALVFWYFENDCISPVMKRCI